MESWLFAALLATSAVSIFQLVMAFMTAKFRTYTFPDGPTVRILPKDMFVSYASALAVILVTSIAGAIAIRANGSEGSGVALAVKVIVVATPAYILVIALTNLVALRWDNRRNQG